MRGMPLVTTTSGVQTSVRGREFTTVVNDWQLRPMYTATLDGHRVVHTM
jgi:hypothetical protein